MNFLKKIFGQEKETATVVNTTQETSSEIPVKESLFTDGENHPESKVKTSPVKIFLETDYRNKGYHDGYNYHCAEVLSYKVRSLLSEFRNLVEEHLENIEKEIRNLRLHRIESEGLSVRLVKKIDLEIEALVSVRSKLVREMELSASEEGLVMRAVNRYRDGFMRGMEDYQQQKMLGIGSGLFG